MKALLVRIGVDQGKGGGRWNGPVDLDSRRFAYVPIPESHGMACGLEKPYDSPQLLAQLRRFGTELPEDLHGRNMHLDPDFEHCTYGDQGQRAVQLSSLEPEDMVVFYAGLRARTEARLVYALIGQITVERLVRATDIADRDVNAHTRRDPIAPDDLVIFGSRSGSGRYELCLPIGDYRARAYRVRRDLLDEWGGINANDGYFQRSARLPKMLQPLRFRDWLERQHLMLVKCN